MKKKVICLFLFYFVIFGYSQNKIIDSLKFELGKQITDSVKGGILGDLAHYYASQNTDSSLFYSSELLNLSKNLRSEQFMVHANKYKGTAYLLSNQYDSARYYYGIAMKQSKDNGLSLSSFYTNLGVLHKREGEYEKALEYYLKGYEYDLEQKNQYGQFLKLMNISNLYALYFKDEDRAIAYAIKALEIAYKTSDVKILNSVGTLLNNIGTLYLDQGDFRESLKYFNRSLERNLRFGNKREIARNYSNIGVVYTDYIEPQKGIDYLNKALEIRKGLDDKIELVETYLALGAAYTKIKLRSSAEKYFTKALKKSKDLKSLKQISDTYYEMMLSARTFKQSENALDYYQNYVAYKDSVINKEISELRIEIETKYESEKKDKEIVQQKLAIEQQASQLLKRSSQTKLMIGLIIFLLTLSILTWFLYQQRQKRKDQEILTLKREQQVKTLESLIEGEEKERLRIAQELHDGVNVDLSAIKYKLTSLLEKNNEVISEVVSMIDRSCEQVRAISHNLVPPALKDFSLVEALEDYCSTTNAIHELEVAFQSIGEPFKISKKEEANIFRIAQELVNNSIKHAEASEIDVQVSFQNNAMQLTIEDNGKGFDTAAAKGKGIGLENVHSRVAYLNAKVDVTSDDNGTSYVIDINTQALS